MWYVGNKGQYWSDLPLLWKIGNFIIQRLYTSLTWRLCIWHDPRLYDSQWRYYIASKFQCIFLTNGIQQLQNPSSTIKIKHFFVNYRYSQNTLLPSLFSLHQTRRVFTTFLRICLVIIFTIITNCSLEIILFNEPLTFYHCIPYRLSAVAQNWRGIQWWCCHSNKMF